MNDKHINDVVTEKERELFIGKNKAKIIGEHANIQIALGGPLWFLYRKCICISIVTFLLQIVFGFTLYIKVGWPAYLYMFLWFVFYLVFGQYLYRKHVDKKIIKIRKKYKNTEDILIYKGGTSVILVVVGFFLYTLVLLVLVFVIGLSLKEYRKSGDMIFYAPDWKLDQVGSLYKKEGEKTCMMQGGALNETGKNLIYHYYGIKEDFSNLNKENIAGIQWYTTPEESRNKDFTSIYLYKKKDVIYIAKFYAKETKDYQKCLKEFDTVKKTIRIK